MALATRITNKSVTIERRATTLDDSGDATGERTELETDLAMRIVNNRVQGQEVGSDAGPISTSTHKGLTNGGHEGQEGDFVIDGDDEYIINYIDKAPGGTIAGDKIYHWEIYMNDTSLSRT